MSYKARLVRLAVKWTPKFLVLWIANMKLKGVARLLAFSLDLDARRAYAQARLAGEGEPIEVLVEGFAVLTDGASYRLIVLRAASNKRWLNSLFSRIVGRPWDIPATPHLAPHMKLIAELLPPPKVPRS